MKYQIEVPSGIWTNKTIVTPLGNNRYLTVKLAQMRSHKLGFKTFLPIPFSDIEITDHRVQIAAKPLIALN